MEAEVDYSEKCIKKNKWEQNRGTVQTEVK